MDTTVNALRELAAFVREAAEAGVLNADELAENGLLADAEAALAQAATQATSPDSDYVDPCHCSGGSDDLRRSCPQHGGA